MSREINLGRIVPKKGVDYFTDSDIQEVVNDVENGDMMQKMKSQCDNVVIVDDKENVTEDTKVFIGSHENEYEVYTAQEIDRLILDITKRLDALEQRREADVETG